MRHQRCNVGSYNCIILSQAPSYSACTCTHPNPEFRIETPSTRQCGSLTESITDPSRACARQTIIIHCTIVHWYVRFQVEHCIEPFTHPSSIKPWQPYGISHRRYHGGRMHLIDQLFVSCFRGCSGDLLIALGPRFGLDLIPREAGSVIRGITAPTSCR